MKPIDIDSGSVALELDTHENDDRVLEVNVTNEGQVNIKQTREGLSAQRSNNVHLRGGIMEEVIEAYYFAVKDHGFCPYCGR